MIGSLTTPAPAARTTIRDAIAGATVRLRHAGVDGPQLDAELLLAHACGWTRARLLAALRDEVPAAATDAFAAGVARRMRREPLAYIVGRQEFWSLDFEVTPAVLIPRPETERIVETVLALLATTPRPRIADPGTGSGCIAIALVRELPRAELWASDLSAHALVVARRNAARLGVAGRIRFECGDLLTPIAGAGPFDVICSNPPYIAAADAVGLQPELGFEPASALFAGDDGLGTIRRLLTEAPRLLSRDGALVMEFGFGQADAIRELAMAAGFARVEIRDDYSGIPRVLVAGKL